VIVGQLCPSQNSSKTINGFSNLPSIAQSIHSALEFVKIFFGHWQFYKIANGHPEAQRAEGSLEILRRYAPQDEQSGSF